MSKIIIVMKETYLRQVKSLAFLFMVLSPFLFMGLTTLSGLAGSSGAVQSLSSHRIALIAQDQSLKDQLPKSGVFTGKYKTLDQAKKALEAEEIAGYVTVDLVDRQVQARYTGDETLSFSSKSLLTQALSDYQTKLNQDQAQLSGDQIRLLARRPKLKEVVTKPFEKMGKMGVFFALILFMYIILITYSTTTAQEIASEKGTKIMQIIFSSLPANRYFYGRMLGILAVLITHIGIYVVVGLLLLKVGEGAIKAMLPEDLLATLWSSLSLTTLLFVIFGVLIYIALAALCGSIVTRVEDVNKAITPVMMLIIAAFFGAMILGQMGTDHILMKIGSFLPFFSTFFMPIREINGYASGLESWASLLILLLSLWGLVYYIGTAYAGLVLQTDDLGLWKSFKKGISSR